MPPTLSQYVSRKRQIPASARSTPYLPTGNILLLTERNAFRFDKRTLTSQSSKFREKIANMSDGSTDVVEGAAVLELPPWVTGQDLSAFLEALWEAPESYPLDTIESFMQLAGILRLSTAFDAPALRVATIAALQVRYPTTLEGWDRVRPPIAPSNPHETPPRTYAASWERDRSLVINLAREVAAYSIIPAAMAMLANDCSAGEVFGVRLPSAHHQNDDQDPFSPTSPPHSAFPFDPIQHTPLNLIDAPSFGLTKEHSHHSSIALLLSIRSLASTCTRPPQRLPPTAGRAPVGASTLLPGSSRCEGFFREVASRLLESLVLEVPVGFPDFVPRVLAVQEDPTRVCRVCWKRFGEEVRRGRERWWEDLPRVVRFAQADGEEWDEGWADERLMSVEG
ncbi:hypothetical protein H0H87_003485 [Tephrocybe sp. NHM501043]|nr:hypothetical protein H0H87_003485 [Tephrocybe sp. NHM501043]